MPILIDGHNLIGRSPDLSLQDPHDEEDLVMYLRAYRARTGKTITVVFDPGGSPGLLQKRREGGVEVVTASQSGGADDLIARRVARSRNPDGCIVVTSDQGLARRVARHGAQVRSAEAFAVELQRSPDAPDEWKDTASLSPEEVNDWLTLFEDG
jgi:predicted RNA-binding protein with PIN domain